MELSLFNLDFLFNGGHKKEIMIFFQKFFQKFYHCFYNSFRHNFYKNSYQSFFDFFDSFLIVFISIFLVWSCQGPRAKQRQTHSQGYPKGHAQGYKKEGDFSEGSGVSRSEKGELVKQDVFSSEGFRYGGFFQYGGVSSLQQTVHVFFKWSHPVEWRFGKPQQLLVRFFDEQNEAIVLPEGIEMEFYSWMPSMGHPLTDPGYFQEQEGHGYVNSSIRFNMGGPWQMKLLFWDSDQNLLKTLVWEETL
jgi:hypothetical protein